jgi:hypothetical protein
MINLDSKSPKIDYDPKEILSYGLEKKDGVLHFRARFKHSPILIVQNEQAVEMMRSFHRLFKDIDLK